MKKIIIHPDMQLTSKSKYINNGGFVASTLPLADIAIVTLTQEIQFTEIISSVCLPLPNGHLTSEIGIYSGWSVSEKIVETFNTTIAVDDEKEKIIVENVKKDVKFAEGLDDN